MPKKKVEQPATVATIQCSICHAVVTPDSYAAHVQAIHAKAPDPPAPQTTTQNFFPPQSSGNGIPAGMQPITGPISGKELAGGNYLKGEDVPNDTNTVTFKVVQFVRDPRGRSQLVAQISPTFGKTLFGFNVTNIRALIAAGYEDLSKVAGRTIVCMTGMQPNPSRGGAPTKALFVQRVE